MLLTERRLRRAACALLTAFAVLFSMVTAAVPALSAYAAGGSCGSSASWTLSGGTLTISGSGTVTEKAWSDYSAQITEVVIEKGITSMPAGSFSGYTALKTLSMGSTLSEIGTFFCSGCSALTKVTFSDALTVIPMCAFRNCWVLGSLSLPSQLTSIGNEAFFNCIALTTLTLPDKVTSVGDSAFYANNIKSLTLNSGLKTIGVNAFYFSCFPSVEIPSSVTTIGKEAFGICYLNVTISNGRSSGYTESEDKCTIIGQTGSAAQTYATTYGHPFVAAGSSTHTHTGTWIVDTEATCEKAGSRHYVCTVCGLTVTETIPATGHSWSDWKTDKAATCTEDGSESRTCSACGEKETRAIAATGHSWGDWKTQKAATCTEDGAETRTCSVCGEKETRAIPATGAHRWSEWKSTVQPTLTTEGMRERTGVGGGEV